MDTETRKLWSQSARQLNNYVLQSKGEKKMSHMSWVGTKRAMKNRRAQKPVHLCAFVCLCQLRKLFSHNPATLHTRWRRQCIRWHCSISQVLALGTTQLSPGCGMFPKDSEEGHCTLSGMSEASSLLHRTERPRTSLQRQLQTSAETHVQNVKWLDKVKTKPNFCQNFMDPSDQTHLPTAPAVNWLTAFNDVVGSASTMVTFKQKKPLAQVSRPRINTWKRRKCMYPQKTRDPRTTD